MGLLLLIIYIILWIANKVKKRAEKKNAARIFSNKRVISLVFIAHTLSLLARTDNIAIPRP